MNDNRIPPIKIPRGGFTRNEDEARWLEQTIIMRANELLSNAGMSGKLAAGNLYDLLLLSLNSATLRGKSQR